LPAVLDYYFSLVEQFGKEEAGKRVLEDVQREERENNA